MPLASASACWVATFPADVVVLWDELVRNGEIGLAESPQMHPLDYLLTGSAKMLSVH